MTTASATKIDNRPNDLLDIRRVQPLIGAEIHGIDITASQPGSIPELVVDTDRAPVPA